MEKYERKSHQCVFDEIKEIDAAQRSLDNGNCENSCNSFVDSLRNPKPLFDTIPFILISKNKVEPFETVGDGFCTIFFRVNKIVSKNCVILELLEPKKCYQCCKKFPPLRRSGECLTIDLDCFCGIQCLKPILGEKPEWEKKKKECHCDYA